MRLFARISRGMVAEAKHLHTKGLSWKRMESLGLKYRFLAQFLQKKITREELEEKLPVAIWQYARRQMTWFKRDTRIHWLLLADKKKIERAITRFFKK